MPFVIGMTSGKISYTKREHISDIKYYRKTKALIKLYQEENIRINY